jgi:small subunit ribosomal protein S6
MMFIISPLHAEDENAQQIIERIQQAIEARGGEVTAVNHGPPWGRRKLAYPIRAYAGGESSRRIFTEGFYVLMTINLASIYVAEIERVLKLSDPILRYLITVVEHKIKPVSEPDDAAEGEVLDDDGDIDDLDVADEDEADADDIDKLDDEDEAADTDDDLEEVAEKDIS